MVMFFPGRTKCLICKNVIEKSDDAVGFPALLKAGHRLHSYSDSALHRECFAASPDKAEVERLYSRFRQIWDERPKGVKTLDEIEEWGKSAFKELDP